MKRFIIETTPMYLGVLDPEWNKHKKGRIFAELKDGFKRFIAVVILLTAFVTYKAYEKKVKLNNLNIREYGITHKGL